jgi:hypothetical protein
MIHNPSDPDEYPPSIFADEVDEKRRDEEDEEGDSSSSGDDGGRKPADDKVKIDHRYIDDYLAEDIYEEGWLDKLKSLALMPFSLIMPGASALAAENDLSRRLMMGRFGLFNKQIMPHDMADPNLIERLEERFQERRERVQRELGLGIAPPLAAFGMADMNPKQKSDKGPKTKQAKIKKDKGISFAEKEMRDDYGARKESTALTSTTSFAQSGDEDILRKINDPNQVGVTTVTPELDLTDIMSDFDVQDHHAQHEKASTRLTITERLADLKDRVMDALTSKPPQNVLGEDFEDAQEGKSATPLQVQVLREELKLEPDSKLPSPLKPFGS